MFHCYRWSRRYAYACAPEDQNRPYYETRHDSRSRRGGGFGIRRPLRYLSYHLDLDESQRRKIAASFERLKLEREQASLDQKRADNALADEFLRDDVSVDDLRNALAPRTDVERNMQSVVAKELYEMGRVLDSEQREEFAHLLRTGVLKF